MFDQIEEGVAGREPKLRRAEPRMFGRRNAASGHPGRSGGALLRWDRRKRHPEFPRAAAFGSGFG